MKVLVTGGAGFIGSHLLVELLQREHPALAARVSVAQHGGALEHRAQAAVERVQPKSVEAAGSDQIPEPKHGEGVILLVEDEAPVRAFASRALRLRGYTVLEADSAEAALKTLEDPNLNVDLFVTDVVMPGKDGPSWVREALVDRPDVRVVFVSGYTEDKLDDQQEKIPNSVFLPKPFSLNDLAETVFKQLK